MSNNIRLLRKERGWSMRELADKMGVHFSTVAKLEKAERKLTPEWIAKFAEAFSIPRWEVTDADAFYMGPTTDHPLPVVYLSNAREWQDAPLVAKTTIPSPETQIGDRAFAFYVDSESYSQIPAGSFVIIDPGERELVEGHSYALLVGGEQGILAEYKGTPPRFEPSALGSNAPALPVGESPFITVGVIAGVYRKFPRLVYQNPTKAP